MKHLKNCQEWVKLRFYLKIITKYKLSLPIKIVWNNVYQQKDRKKWKKMKVENCWNMK